MWISRFPTNFGKCEAVAIVEVVRLYKKSPSNNFLCLINLLIKFRCWMALAENIPYIGECTDPYIGSVHPYIGWPAAILVSHNSTFMHCTVFIGQPPNHLIILKSISFHSTEIIIVVRIFGLQCFHSWSSKVKGQGRIRLAAHSLLHILFPTCWIHHGSICYRLVTFVHTVGVMRAAARYYFTRCTGHHETRLRSLLHQATQSCSFVFSYATASLAYVCSMTLRNARSTVI